MPSIEEGRGSAREAGFEVTGILGLYLRVALTVIERVDWSRDEGCWAGCTIMIVAGRFNDNYALVGIFSYTSLCLQG